MKTRPTPRAEDTRRRIYEAAMELFREKGFEQTTMRDIAAKAGVALGGAYYYFSSKEAIVLAFYHEMQEGSHEAVLESMAGEKKLKERIRCVLEKRFELLAPNRKFCDALFRHAPDSKDPLSPFSEETRPIRERAIEHMRIAMEGGDVKVPADLKPQLPYLLWLYQMGLILFWLYDRSES
ncbi:MAG TPA: TetR family transcriptional regulator, partial [Candidatus Angelobacter sp.]|nr:TetR family transcriptional regulator [Candidatus Angelobacter sp.]